MAESAKGVRRQIAFYGSTPAYRGVLELHGWGDLQTELNAMSKQGEWVAMGELIDDEMLDAFAVVAEPDELGRRAARPLRRRRRPASASTRPTRATPSTWRPGAREPQGRALIAARSARGVRRRC